MVFDRLGPDFDDFVRESSRPLLRAAYLLTGDHGHAEDILQTALLRTARHWSRAGRQPAAYARRVLVNLAKDRHRSRSRRVGETALAEREPATPAADSQVVLRHTLVPPLQHLPARQRAVLVLRYFEGLSVAETADALRCSDGTVKSQTHHALARLRELLGDSLDHYEDHQEQEINHAN